MFALANDLLVRTARLFRATQDGPGLWAISAHGHVVGTLVCESGVWRLSWFDGADPRLVQHAGTLDGDIDGLADALSARLGQPVRLEALPV